jgi:hypothetical protein
MKKRPVEADLDAPDAPPRPGSKIADRAIANTKPSSTRKTTRNQGPSRPGAGAAARAVAESKRKGGKSR